MRIITIDNDMFREYKKNDLLLRVLRQTADAEDERFTSHKWLLDSLPKRLIFHLLYGDLLVPSTKRRWLLDVGGGYTSLTKCLLAHHDYTLLDIMAHDPTEAIHAREAATNTSFWINQDWYTFELGAQRYDIVLANDLFPNVDQRLEMFLQRYLPVCAEIRLSLTYYNTPRFYMTKRIDADEVLCMLAWNGEQVALVLRKFADRIDGYGESEIVQNTQSVFPNRRQVTLVTIRGNQA